MSAHQAPGITCTHRNASDRKWMLYSIHTTVINNACIFYTYLKKRVSVKKQFTYRLSNAPVSENSNASN